MIDLTPLDVRKKREDFAKALRGYDPQEVDTFLELVAERLEALVKENLQLSERTERLSEQVTAQEGRENAVQEALVTAQSLREDVKQQAQREADLVRREAQADIDKAVAEAELMLEERRQSLAELERHRIRCLKGFRTLLERELETVEVEESRAPLEDVTLEIDLGGPGEPEDAEGEPTEGEGAAADEINEEEAEEPTADADEGDAVAEGEDPVAASGDEPGEDAERVEEDASLVGSQPAEDDTPETDAEAGDEAGDEAGEVEASADDEVEEAQEDDRDEDDDSLWLNSLLDGESRDEGRWS